jgi:hypothetical protein
VPAGSSAAMPREGKMRLVELTVRIELMERGRGTWEEMMRAVQVFEKWSKRKDESWARKPCWEGGR